MRAIIYTRVSSDEQVEGTSLEHQEMLCRSYCEQHSMEVVAVFREEGESAKSLSLNNRKKFLEGLEFCRRKSNNVQTFVVLRVDRFARNTEDHFSIRQLLRKYDVTLHSVTEPIGDKPAEKFIETVLAGAAEYDNAVRKQRCMDGMSQKIKQGLHPWKPPLGYQSNHFNKRGEKKTGPDIPDTDVFPIIQRGLKDYLTGRFSMAAIARSLDENGLRAIRGKKTTPQMVDNILGRHLNFYAGIVVNPWTGEEFEGLHQPMITKAEMHQIQLIRSGKSSVAKCVKKDRYNAQFPLRRTVLCPSCLRSLTGSASRGNGGVYPYYHCYCRDCERYGKSVPKGKLEQDFLGYLKNITPTAEFLDGLRASIIDHWKECSDKYKTHTKKFERKIAEITAKRRRIYEMHEDGSYTKEEFLDRKKVMDEKFAEVALAMNETKIDDIDIEQALSFATSCVLNAAALWFNLPPASRLGFQQFVLPEGITYDRDSGFGTAKLGLIFELNQLFDGQKSKVVRLNRFDWNQMLAELKEWETLRQTEGRVIEEFCGRT